MGNWIKMQVNLDSNPHVVQIAEALSVPELHVVGMLWKLWSWADQHTENGNAPSVTENWVDRYVGVQGFAKATQISGWLDLKNGITIPNFQEHNGQSAKARSLTQSRVKRFRNADTVTPALPEKRREDKIREEVKTEAPAAAVAPLKRKASKFNAEELTNGDHSQLIEVWHDLFKAQFGTPYSMVGGRDGKAVKTLLHHGSVEELMSVATRAWALNGFLGQRASTMHGLESAWNEINAELKRKETNGEHGNSSRPRNSAMHQPDYDPHKYDGIG